MTSAYISKDGYQSIKFIFLLQIEKAIVPYKDIETTGATDKSAFVKFEAMMVDIGDISGSQNRHITAGLEYGDSAYIWVGQASLTTKATLKTMSVSMITIITSFLSWYH